MSAQPVKLVDNSKYNSLIQQSVFLNQMRTRQEHFRSGKCNKISRRVNLIQENVVIFS